MALHSNKKAGLLDSELFKDTLNAMASLREKFDCVARERDFLKAQLSNVLDENASLKALLRTQSNSINNSSTLFNNNNNKNNFEKNSENLTVEKKRENIAKTLSL